MPELPEKNPVSDPEQPWKFIFLDASKHLQNQFQPKNIQKWYYFYLKAARSERRISLSPAANADGRVQYNTKYIGARQGTREVGGGPDPNVRGGFGQCTGRKPGKYDAWKNWLWTVQVISIY